MVGCGGRLLMEECGGRVSMDYPLEERNRGCAAESVMIRGEETAVFALFYRKTREEESVHSVVVPPFPPFPVVDCDGEHGVKDHFADPCSPFPPNKPGSGQVEEQSQLEVEMSPP
jgi:hypothetical protein